MVELDEFKYRQAEILQIISDLRIMLVPEQLKAKPNALAAHDHLCSMGRKLKEHLAAEDKGLYPPLLTHEDPKLKSLAWGFISGEKPLRKQFDNYYQEWLKECDFTFTEEFMNETKSIFDLIEARIEREQTVLFPKLEESGLFEAAAG
ncbi:MAG: hemerythrin domain-containing protein [Gammaproteobacteria bacterium]|nr:hemerythrin domain-containing protein [Gammaproteobacteria bacterium]